MPKPFQRRDASQQTDDLPVAPPQGRQPLAEVPPPAELVPPEEPADESASMTLPDIQQMIRKALDAGITPEEIVSQIMAEGQPES